MLKGVSVNYNLKTNDDVIISNMMCPGFLLFVEMKLSRGEGWDPINRFNSTIFMCLSQGRTWIYNVVFHGHFCIQ